MLVEHLGFGDGRVALVASSRRVIYLLIDRWHSKFMSRGIFSCHQLGGAVKESLTLYGFFGSRLLTGHFLRRMIGLIIVVLRGCRLIIYNWYLRHR